MSDIVKLISALAEEEIDILKYKYTKSSNKSSENGQKRLILLNLIVDDRVYDDAILCSLIYGKSKTKAYTQLKARLESDIVTIMSFEGGRISFKSEYFKAKNQVRKLIVNAEILLARGLDDIAISTLNRALVMSKNYELSIDTLLIYDLLQRHDGQKKGLNVFKKYENVKFKEYDIIKYKFESFSIFYEIVLQDLFQKENKGKYIELAQRAIETLSENYNLTKSIEINSLLLRSRIYFFHLIGNYDSAHQYAKDYLDITYSSKILSSLSNKAGAHMQLGTIQLYRSDYVNSIDNALIAASLFPVNSINQLRALEIQFVANMVLGNHSKLEIIMTMVRNHASFKSSSLIGEVWRLREVAVFFVLNNFQDSLKKLRQHTNQLSEKSGWKIGYRILELITLLEMEMYDWFEPRLTSIKIAVRRREIAQRDVAIIKLLSLLKKYHYDYDKLINNERGLFMCLQNSKDEMRWDPFGYEVIPFHDWIKSKEKY